MPRDDVLRSHSPQHRGHMMALLLLTSPCVQSRLLGSSETAGGWMTLPPPLQSALSPTPSLKDTEGTVSLPGPKKDFGHFSEMKIIMLDKVGSGKK